MILNKGAWVDRDLFHKGPPLSLHPTPFHRLKLRLILKRKQTDTHTNWYFKPFHHKLRKGVLLINEVFFLGRGLGLGCCGPKFQMARRGGTNNSLHFIILLRYFLIYFCILTRIEKRFFVGKSIFFLMN